MLMTRAAAVFVALELCRYQIQFVLYGVFLPSGVGFPVLRSVLAVVGVSAFHLSEFRRFPSVRDDLVTACPSAVRFCLVSAFSVSPWVSVPFAGFRAFLGLFRGCMLSFHHITAAVHPSTYRRTLIFDHLRLFAALVVLYALKWLQAVFRAFLGVLRVFREAG